MAGFLDIKSGGRIRYNAPTLAGQTWSRGQFIVIDSSGNLELASPSTITLGSNGYTSPLGGPAGETCVSPTTGNPRNDTATVIAGNTGSVLLGEAVVITDNLSGVGGFTPGLSPVYALSTGNYGSVASGVKCGTALTSPVTNGKLKFLYRPNGSP